MDEREKRLAEKLGPHRVRLDELNQPWFVGDVTTVALMLWRECLRLMAQQEWVKVEERLPEKARDVEFMYEPQARELVGSCIAVGWLDGDGNWYATGSERTYRVTHWREITLPEGGKE